MPESTATLALLAVFGGLACGVPLGMVVGWLCAKLPLGLGAVLILIINLALLWVLLPLQFLFGVMIGGFLFASGTFLGYKFAKKEVA